MYKLLRKFLFLFPPEAVHHFSMTVLRLFSGIPFCRKILASPYSQVGGRGSEQERKIWGLEFRNPVGIAAGFDKNAIYLSELELLGFGFVEIGTVTPLPQAGNERPRLFRLPKDQALINRMGFNNDGVERIALRLKKWKEGKGLTAAPNRRMIIGGNVGKNKRTPNEQAWKDYEICFLGLWDVVDYFVVNLSSPNTPGLRDLLEKNPLRKILTHLQLLNERLASAGKAKPKPLLLKISPDLSWSQLDEIIELAQEIKLDGLVASNTSLSREGLLTDADSLQHMNGGLSGLPIKQKATAILEYIKNKTGGSLPLIGSGGIFTASDAFEKFQAGACLIEVWTGFIYEGPAIVSHLLKSDS
jgi:dihydroorotate dehydrogenase